MKDLFAEPCGLEEFVQEKNQEEAQRTLSDESPTRPAAPPAAPSTQLASTLTNPPTPPETTTPTATPVTPTPTPPTPTSATPTPALTSTTPVHAAPLEQVFAELEDVDDLQAAKQAKAEASAELAEFDENIPWEEKAEQNEGLFPSEAQNALDITPAYSQSPAAASTPPISKTEKEIKDVVSKVYSTFSY